MATLLSDHDQARVEAAEQLRRSMHLLMAHNPSVAQLRALADALTRAGDDLAQAPLRPAREFEPLAMTAPPDGQEMPATLDRPVSGIGNPFSVPMTVVRDGDAVVTTVVLEKAFEGAPGRSHGGMVSAIFDDLLGSVPMLHGKVAFTASLTINYVAPSPILAPVTFRAWADRIEGKKLYLVGEAHHNDELVTTATALFIDASEFFANLGSAQ